MNRFIVTGISACLTVFASSCLEMKKAAYFCDLNDGSVRSIVPGISLIHKNYILSISVNRLNPEVSALYNAPNLHITSMSTVEGATSQLEGWLVNMDGSFLFPVAGIANEQIKLPEAIGFAGDHRANARRDNILLIRVQDGNKIVKRPDLVRRNCSVDSC